MDTLSELLADIRLEQGVYRHARLRHPWALSMPASDRICFYAITHGQAWVRMGGGHAVVVRAGEIVLFQPGAAHLLSHNLDDLESERTLLLGTESAGQPYGELAMDGAGEVTRLIFGSCRVSGVIGTALLNSLPDLLHVANPAPGTPAWLGMIHHLISDSILNERPGQGAMINRLCEMIWMESLRTHVSNLPEGTRGWLLALRDRYLSPALGHMHGRPAHPWTVPELAQEVGLSRSAFAARFSDVMGETPTAYLTRYRMQLAARELRIGNRCMAAIAQSVGYASETAFSQAFKREMGMSPSAWRIKVPLAATG